MPAFAKGLKRFLLFGFLPLLLIGGVVAYVERDTLLTCYYLHRLEKAKGDEANRWAERLAGLDEEVLPDVLGLLTLADERVCANARAVLVCLGKRWGPEDPRRLELMNQAIKQFHRFSASGQAAVLGLAVEWLEPGASCPHCLTTVCGRLLGEVHHQPRPELVGPAVELALGVLSRSKQADEICAGRELTRAALQSSEPATRMRALQLAIQPGIDLRKDAVPLMNDPQALVRRAAMFAVSGAEDVIQTDNLLPWLHDPDPEVRRMCRAALEKRGLKPEYIRLANLITDPNWQVRVSVLDNLEDAEDLDAGAWLRRLSHDVSPAVRAAAIRAACENSTVDLSDRLDQMARDDPSPTVSELARHYLEQSKVNSLAHPQ